MNVIVSTAVCLLAVTLGAATPATAYGTGSWIKGRATFFGRDAWSLHEGALLARGQISIALAILSVRASSSWIGTPMPAQRNFPDPIS